MAGYNPHPAGTGRRGNFTKQTPGIVRHRADCANCRTPLYPREFHYCKPCRAYLNLYRALRDMRGLYE
jgi:hypothetical protein